MQTLQYLGLLCCFVGICSFLYINPQPNRGTIHSTTTTPAAQAYQMNNRSLSIGQQIHLHRLEQGFSEVQLAQAIGISPYDVTVLEMDRAIPTPEIAEALEVTLQFVLEMPVEMELYYRQHYTSL